MSTNTKQLTTEFIKFKLIQMPCCGHLLCWVNPRFPSYCPECGKRTLGKFGLQGCILINDEDAQLKVHEAAALRPKEVQLRD